MKQRITPLRSNLITAPLSFGHRTFYAVKMRSGTIMVFDWNASEIAEADLNRGVVGIIRSIEADGAIPAELEAKRLFAENKFEPSAVVRADRTER